MCHSSLYWQSQYQSPPAEGCAFNTKRIKGFRHVAYVCLCSTYLMATAKASLGPRSLHCCQGQVLGTILPLSHRDKDKRFGGQWSSLWNLQLPHVWIRWRLEYKILGYSVSPEIGIILDLPAKWQERLASCGQLWKMSVAVSYAAWGESTKLHWLPLGHLEQKKQEYFIKSSFSHPWWAEELSRLLGHCCNLTLQVQSKLLSLSRRYLDVARLSGNLMRSTRIDALCTLMLW